MNCKQVDRLLIKHLYGDLSIELGRRIAEHLAHCAACSTLYEAFKGNSAVVAALGSQVSSKPMAAAAIDTWRNETILQSPPVVARNRRFIAIGAIACLLPFLFFLRELQSRPRPRVVPAITVTKNTCAASNVISHRDGHPTLMQKYLDKTAPNRAADNLPSAPIKSVVTGLSGSNPAIDDLKYVNSDPVEILRGWAGTLRGAHGQNLAAKGAPMGDDFVYLEFPRIAGLSEEIANRAITRYRQEQAIVDERLGKKVDLAVKGIAFADLCKQLADKTGIQMRAGRTVADEKITIFCEKQPLREIMRQITHVFAFSWQRDGAEGNYTYTLMQPVRAQLVEEDLRNKDIDAALLAVDDAMAAGPAKTPGAQAYQLLTPGERSALRNGKEIVFDTDQELPAGFPADWSKNLLKSFDGLSNPNGTYYPSQTPGFTAAVTLSMNHTELGQVTLESKNSVRGPGFPGISSVATLATGRSPSSAKPENRAANKGLEADPTFGRQISVAPQPCSKVDFMTAFGLDFSKGRHIEDDIQARDMLIDAHVNSSDVWEAVHAQTGLPIVADYYTHIYPVSGFNMEKASILNVLNAASDSLGAHWKKDGDFVQCRSAAFFWDKLKEVPNRLLDRWQADSERNTGLPLDDLLQMAALTDQQLDSKFVGQGVKHCRNLMEWAILASPEYTGMRRKYDTVRPMARVLAAMPKAVREQMQSTEGARADALQPGQQEALARIFPMYAKQTDHEGMRIRLEYVPAGRYTWRPLVDTQEDATRMMGNPPPLVSAKSADDALAQARQIYSNATADSIHRSYGQLALSFLFADGTSVAIGKRPPSWRIAR